MKFLIVTHVPHLIHKDKYYAYAPYVNEMNLWIKYADKIMIAAPEDFSSDITPIHTNYQHQNIDFIRMKSFDLLSARSFLISLIKIPLICMGLFKAMKEADHIHLRCPGNMGLLGCLVQIFFSGKIKTAKYAGNWDPKSKQPWSYRLQRSILNNSFLTRNMTVLVYGQWPDISKNIKPFFTATYHENESLPLRRKEPSGIIKFIFAGGLVAGKNPGYAVKLIESLQNQGKKVQLDIYGNGILYQEIQEYIVGNRLQDYIILHGNQNKEALKQGYQQADFVVLASDSEGWPKVIAEGMFWGCVPVATRVSCVPYMLDYGKRGILLSMELTKDVATISALIDDHHDFLAKSNAAIEWSRAFTLEVFEGEIKRLLQQ